MNAEQSGSIPLGAAAVCLTCLVIFWAARGACPRCGSEIGIASVRVSGNEIGPVQAEKSPAVVAGL